MGRIRVAWFSDSPMGSTGFGTVARNVLAGLYHMYPGQYEIHCMGIGQPPYSKQNPLMYPYHIYPALGQPGSFGKQSIAGWLQMVNPDVLVVNLDTWMTSYMTDPNFMADRRFPIIFYQPLDSITPDNSIPKSWCDTIAKQDFTVTYNKWSRDIFQKAVPGAADRISYIPHGVDTEFFKPCDSNRFGLDDNIVVGMVAVNQIRKDFPSLIKAMRMVVDEIPEAVLYMHCNWHGPVGFDIGEIVDAYNMRDSVVQLSIDGKFIHRGDMISALHMPMVYSALDVHVLSTLGEGWGLPHTEAMACGVPSISTHWSGTIEQNPFEWQKINHKDARVIHPVIPLLRPIIDVEDMAKKIYDLCSKTKSERKELGRQCREFVTSNYMWRDMIPEWHKTIESAISSYGCGVSSIKGGGKKVLLIENSGGLGDILTTTPAIRSLHESGNEVYLSVRDSMVNNVSLLLSGNPYLNALIPSNQINYMKFDIIRDISTAPAHSEVSELPHITTSRPVAYCKALGIKMDDYSLDIFPNEELVKIADSELSKLTNKKRVLLCVKSAESYKDYPAHSFDRIAEELSKDCYVISSALSLNSANQCFEGGVDEFVALISVVDVVVCADTLALHIAGTLGKSCIGLFGPTDSRVRIYDKSVPIQSPMKCSPCWRNANIGCPLNGSIETSPCMEICPTDIVEKVRQVLSIDAK